MALKIVKFIFFGNYFIGLLAIALTLESTIQLKLPFNSMAYYALVVFAPIVYYTYAYMGVNKLTRTTNPRTQWYIDHRQFIKISQWCLSIICIALLSYLLWTHMAAMLSLPIVYWFAVAAILLIALLYYGLLPAYFFNLNLRNTGWLKPFIIGFIWACTANVLPLLMLRLENNTLEITSTIWIWLFVKNWMFCTVNAIMFDLKDYEIDANKELKTFAVQFGLTKTIFYILIPLLCIGMCSLLVYTHIQNFPPPTIIFNFIPFLLTLIVAYSMIKKKEILFYLIVIDGLILVKALCGIAGGIL